MQRAKAHCYKMLRPSGSLILDKWMISERLEVERSRNRSYVEILIFENLMIAFLY